MRQELISGVGRIRVCERHRSLPPLSEYEAWHAEWSEQSPNHRHRNHGMTPNAYRRIVQLRQLGDSWAAIARPVGFGGPNAAKRAFERLPRHLQNIEPR